MRELRFVAVSEDGRGLVLSDANGGEYAVAIDDAVRAAVRQDRSRLGHLQVETEAIRPRDIQARIRAGETAEEVAAAAGIPLEKVRRYEGPVLAEREHVAGQAQSATVRDTGSAEGPAPRLGELIHARFDPLGIDLSVLGWDAWRREDGRWVVRLVYPDSARVRAALWLYDPERRVVFPQDAQAMALVEGTEPQDPRTRAARAREQTASEHAGTARPEGAAPGPTPTPVRRLASVPREPDQVAAATERGVDHRAGAASEGFGLTPSPQDVQLPLDTVADVVAATNTDAAADSAADIVAESADDTEAEAAEAYAGSALPAAENAGGHGAGAVTDGQETPRHAADPTRKQGRAVRRAAVPSWDDIVFGTRKKD
jgi:hypothetical protein